MSEIGLCREKSPCIKTLLVEKIVRLFMCHVKSYVIESIIFEYLTSYIRVIIRSFMVYFELIMAATWISLLLHTDLLNMHVGCGFFFYIKLRYGKNLLRWMLETNIPENYHFKGRVMLNLTLLSSLSILWPVILYNSSIDSTSLW